MDSDQQDKIAQFSAVTGANPSVAQTALNSANWDLEQAVGLYFAANEEPEGGDEEDEDEPIEPTPATPATAQPTASSSTRNARGGGGNPPRMRTLRDLQSGGDDDDEKDENQDMFAGGEKSGLAVQNPGEGNQPIDHFRNIMNQARQNRDRPGGAGEEEEQPLSANFMGRAQTLGGDDAPSRVVSDPEAATPQRRQLPRVTRTLHLWADGVSIDDGPLLRFDDPANQNIMSEINQGRAPKALLDVEPDQEVDLNLDPHKGENYVAPKPKYKPFGGSGQRLGSPTPGIAASSSASAPLPDTKAPASSAHTVPASANSSTEAPIDESQPTLQMQVRLGDGTRLSSRFNTTQTIGDVYAFVTAAQPTDRPWVLQTTFPPSELTDKSKVLGEMSDFKRGGVVVQKWK